MGEVSPAEATIERLRPLLSAGEERSPWYLISQQDISAFAELTHDHNFIHVDPVRAASESHFGTTIAHGFLTMSLLPHLINEMPREVDSPYRHAATMVNYGFDKLRFVSPVKVGSRIRARRTLVDVRPKGPDWVLLSHAVVVDIEGEAKPAFVGRWLTLMVCRADVPSAGGA
ncbi:MAG: MaoC family dehydratase [Planctomycetaceae bacterium]